LEKSTGIQLQYVNLGEGSEKAVIDGNADMMCDFAKYSLPLYRDGKVNALAVLGKHRWFAAPDVPTFEEMGVPGVYFSYWDAVWAPKGTPKEIITKLNSAIIAALADPGLQKQLADQVEEIPPRNEQTPEALAAYQKAEAEKWGPIIKAGGTKHE
jgi:tripartite-type tricarboxylate transporter receptor subunit TctC